MMRRALSDNSEDVVLAHDQITLSVNFHFCSPVFGDEDLVPLFHGELDDFSVFIAFARSESDYFPFLGLFLSGIGNDDTALFYFLLFERVHEHTIAERLDVHNGHRAVGVFVLIGF
jgi:hypothetical protein